MLRDEGQSYVMSRMKLGNCSNKLCWQENKEGFTILGLPFIMDGMGTPSVMKSSSLSSISSSPGSAEVLPPIQQAILNSHQLSDISFVLTRRLTEEKEERCRDDDACWLLCRRALRVIIVQGSQKRETLKKRGNHHQF
jgi:hypothetical protein